MLVAAKVLVQEDKPCAAIECTREVRNLAERRSALPGGSSGVSKGVTHEAFKLEVSNKSGGEGGASHTSPDDTSRANSQSKCLRVSGSKKRPGTTNTFFSSGCF